MGYTYRITHKLLLENIAAIVCDGITRSLNPKSIHTKYIQTYTHGWIAVKCHELTSKPTIAALVARMARLSIFSCAAFWPVHFTGAEFVLFSESKFILCMWLRLSITTQFYLRIIISHIILELCTNLQSIS